MTGEEIADLRHDLLTPVNHIIGYGEMLQEDTEAMGLPKLVAALEKILAVGRDMNVLLTQPLSATGNFPEPAQLHALIVSLSGQVVSGCDLIGESVADLADDTLAVDLGRIRVAANRLVELAARRLGPPSSG